MFWFFGLLETYWILAPCPPGIDCIGRQSLNHWTARGVPIYNVMSEYISTKKDNFLLFAYLFYFFKDNFLKKE